MSRTKCRGNALRLLVPHRLPRQFSTDGSREMLLRIRSRIPGGETRAPPLPRGEIPATPRAEFPDPHCLAARKRRGRARSKIHEDPRTRYFVVKSSNHKNLAPPPTPATGRFPPPRPPEEHPVSDCPGAPLPRRGQRLAPQSQIFHRISRL